VLSNEYDIEDNFWLIDNTKTYELKALNASVH